MEEYFTREEAVKLCLSYQHLIHHTFTYEDGRVYTVNFILPVPYNEINEFVDLLKGYIQTGDRTDLFVFDARQRKDEFIPVLFCRVDIGIHANLLSVCLSLFADQEGQLKYGFEINSDHLLY